MTDSFHHKLSEFTHKTARVYIDGGAPGGFPGFVLSVNEEYMVLLSVCDEKKRYVPRTITVVPISKITAISRYDYSSCYSMEHRPPTVCRTPDTTNHPAGLNIGILIIIMIVLMSLTTETN